MNSCFGWFLRVIYIKAHSPEIMVEIVMCRGFLYTITIGEVLPSKYSILKWMIDIQSSTKYATCLPRYLPLILHLQGEGAQERRRVKIGRPDHCLFTISNEFVGNSSQVPCLTFRNCVWFIQSQYSTLNFVIFPAKKLEAYFTENGKSVILYILNR